MAIVQNLSYRLAGMKNVHRASKRHAIKLVCLLRLRGGGAAPVDVGTRNQVLVDHGIKRADTLVQFLGNISQLCGDDCPILFLNHSRWSPSAGFFRRKYSRTVGPEIGGGGMTKPIGPSRRLSRFIFSINWRCDFDSLLLLLMGITEAERPSPNST
jgi:hypothetical protein